MSMYVYLSLSRHGACTTKLRYKKSRTRGAFLLHIHHPSLKIRMPAKSSAKGGKLGGKVKGNSGDGKSVSRSHRAGLQFPVSRIHRMLRKSALGRRIGSGAPGTCVSVALRFIFLTRDLIVCSLPRSCARVPVCRDSRTGWQRCPR